MTRRQLAYLALANFVGFMVIAFAGYGYIDHVDSQRRAGEARAAAERAEQAEATRKAFCNVVRDQIEVYREAVTPVGVGAFTSWTDLGRLFRCE